MTTCYTCKHLATNMDDDEWRFGGSEVTPAESFTIFCKLGHWRYYEGPAQELREALLQAEHCSDHTYLEIYGPPQSPHEDYVGHLRRAAYCQKCSSNLVKGRYFPHKSDGTLELDSPSWITYCQVCTPEYKQHAALMGIYREPMFRA
jgi:hypothetical protein